MRDSKERERQERYKTTMYVSSEVLKLEWNW